MFSGNSLFGNFSDESILLDLKHLLIEAKQKVPPFLANLVSENEQYLNIGGKFELEILFLLHALWQS
jgi:hypothetical protein